MWLDLPTRKTNEDKKIRFNYNFKHDFYKPYANCDYKHMLLGVFLILSQFEMKSNPAIENGSNKQIKINKNKSNVLL